ncbi:unnamed protein product [Ectocarpus sp. 12 AP-2014]
MKHPGKRKGGQTKHLRKGRERLGLPARRMDRSHGVLRVVLMIFGRKGRRTAKEAMIRSTAWTIWGSTSTGTLWCTTTTRSSSNGGVHVVTQGGLS